MRCPAGLAELIDLVAAGGCVVLSGAGLSTESGIPDYRGPSGALRSHSPMQYLTFRDDPAARHRYWARSHIGWPQLASARPNIGHRAVASIEHAGQVDTIITQNVDGLHQAAGGRQVIELHGTLGRVVCLSCRTTHSRKLVAGLLRAANPGFAAEATAINPDGDVDLPDHVLDGFRMVDCPSCAAGPLKPDVVFFGETVPRDRVERCYAVVDSASSLLVLGSSLAVASGYRFVLRARKIGIPIAIVNQGPTRGDAHARVKVDAPLGAVLSEVAAAVQAYGPERPDAPAADAAGAS